MAQIPPHLIPAPYLNANQHRLNPPTQYENLLGDAIEAAYRQGIDSLPELVRSLNDQFVPSPGGQPWTEDLFTAEMRRLGA
jgi:hypothetical protein